ncbi:hypothetical protein ACHAQK_003266 [Fusarium lateritium]
MEDWAFTNGGVAYNTGKPNRPQNQVIKVRLTANLGSSFSEREVNYDDPRRAEIDELAIVVGECFDKLEKECITPDSVRKRVVDNFDEFDKDEHAWIDTRETGLVVRMIKDRMATYYVLKNKQDGLCEVQQLGSIKRTCKFIAWYSEFVTGSRDVHRERQRKDVRESIQRLRDALIEARAGSLGQPHNENDGNDHVDANDVDADVDANDANNANGFDIDIDVGNDDSSDSNDDMDHDSNDSNDGMDCDDSDNSSVTIDNDYGDDRDDSNDHHDNSAGL